MKLLNNVAGITLLAFSFVSPLAIAAGETPEQMFKELSAKASKAKQFENSNSVVLFEKKKLL
ncbi:hypothetical protein [Psychromonas sp. KJ10-2]|uniref:hypothetical protein n=1 Tax=Psychromonas sp. KJ10-2 TaxID=3391822 RepID=UPI0039B3ECDF